MLPCNLSTASYRKGRRYYKGSFLFFPVVVLPYLFFFCPQKALASGSILMAQGNARLFVQPPGSPDEVLDIRPLSFELPSENIAARKRKREYREYYTQLLLQRKKAKTEFGPPGSPDEAMDISPLSLELPSENSAARKMKHEYREYYRQLLVQRKKAKSGSNPCQDAAATARHFSSSLTKANAADKLDCDEPGRKNEAQVKPVDLAEKKILAPLRSGTPSKSDFLLKEQKNSLLKEQGGIAEKKQKDFSLRVGDAARNVSSKTKRRNEEQEELIAENVRRILSNFCAVLRRLEWQEEAEGRYSSETKARLHQKAADMLKPHWEKLPKKNLGHVCGIQVGAEFQSRVMLNMVGMHKPNQAGIDYLQAEETGQGVSLATSIVVSGGYEDNIDNGDVLIYTGHGGNDYEKSKKQIKDQKLTAGNRALVNSCQHRQPVRVIRLCMSNERVGRSFIYDGLYNVEHWWPEKGRSGFLVFKFKLKRQQGQPPRISHVVHFMRNSQGKTVGSVIKEDIGEGQDKFRVPVVSSVDDVLTIDEFEYLLTVKYPRWVGEPSLSEGCRCIGGCTDDKECLCARRNGGDFPYTRNGKLVKAKPVVYECGPSCRCPPSCRNRVTQHGLKHKLEVFRSQRNGWGVRPLEFIEAGEFITEYTGNLVAHPTLNASTSKTMFPIRSISMEGNWGDLGGIIEDEVVSTLPSQVIENMGFYVDASTSGNASRFINRSSRPNLFAQYVLYDHHDIRIPHVMFFASENISPRLELSISSSPQQNNNKQFCCKAGYSGKARPNNRCRK